MSFAMSNIPETIPWLPAFKWYSMVRTTYTEPVHKQIRQVQSPDQVVNLLKLVFPSPYQ